MANTEDENISLGLYHIILILLVGNVQLKIKKIQK